MSDLREAYKKAGVDVEEGYKAVEIYKSEVKSTYTNRVIATRAGFGGLFDLSSLEEYGIKEPVLVSGTDGVGTKLKLAFDMEVYNTVGIDLVAMSINDVICTGARPLYFLDYIGTGKLDASQAGEVVKGIALACRESETALIGGETAEMPGFYKEKEFDLAGFAVGVVDKKKIVDGTGIKKGDVLIGLSSSGPHSNGYSLIRKILEDAKLDLKQPYGDRSLGMCLLEPTKIYVKEVFSVIDKFDIKAMAHITGGGFNENLGRILPHTLSCKIQAGSWRIPEIFNNLAEWGKVPSETMHAVFNMGIGYVFVVAKEDAEAMLQHLREVGSEAYQIGEIVEGNGSVHIEGLK